VTEIAFHFNLLNKMAYACRLVRKAYGRGQAVGVLAPAHALHELDQQLWTFSALDFVPHCLSDAPRAVVTASPVVLTSDCAGLDSSELLVHVGLPLPSGFERFKRLIELVGTEANDRAEARKRWRYYTERGYTVRSFDLAERNTQRVQ
jgi:DNA polymerase-3 subunit chi